MATELRLPEQLAGVDSITVTRWLVKVGDAVKPGDILLEVATDKVDTEIPAIEAGVILKINYGDGELLPAEPVLALIGAAGETATSATPAQTPAVETTSRAPVNDPELPRSLTSDQGDAPQATPVARRMAEDLGIPLDGIRGTGLRGQVTKDDVLAYQASHSVASQQAAPAASSSTAVAVDPDLADIASPTVRRLAVENTLDLRVVAAGRPLSTLTKYDVLSFIASRDAGKPVTVAPRRVSQPVAAVSTTPTPVAQVVASSAPTVAATPAAKPQVGEDLVPHSRMRQLVAKNTVQSAFGAPHVTTMWDVNMTAVLEHRKAKKGEFAASGVNLTITAYFVPAIIAGLKAVPAANASWSDDGLILKRAYNIGMAVALPIDKNGVGGLIVPVIHNAGDLNLLGVARAINDLAERARTNQLKSDDLQGGTFTLTNYGTSGSRFQTPIIVNGQAGILGVGAVEKRPVVVSQGHPLEANTGDYLAFLPMTTLGFSYDHRILDGATADAFCAAVKNALENWK